MKKSTNWEKAQFKKVKCMNSKKESKYFMGKICENSLNISEDKDLGLCWECTNRLITVQIKKHKDTKINE